MFLDLPKSTAALPTFTDRSGGKAGAQVGSPWWPDTASGADYPTYAQWTQGMPSPAEWLESTGFGKERNDPAYGQMPEENVNKWFDTVAAEKLKAGMEANAARYADAGYAPQYNPAEATGRLLQGLEGQRAGLQYENAQGGLQRRAGLYNTILSSMASREQGIMAPYLAMFSKGIGGSQAGNASGVAVAQPGQQGMQGYNSGGPVGASMPTKGSTPAAQGATDSKGNAWDGYGTYMPSDWERAQAGGYADMYIKKYAPQQDYSTTPEGD